MGAIKSHPIKILNSRETTNHIWRKNRKWLNANLSRQVFYDVVFSYNSDMCLLLDKNNAYRLFLFLCKSLNLSRGEG